MKIAGLEVNIEYDSNYFLTTDEIESIRINNLIVSKHEELVLYLKEKYPEEFI